MSSKTMNASVVAAGGSFIQLLAVLLLVAVAIMWLNAASESGEARVARQVVACPTPAGLSEMMGIAAENSMMKTGVVFIRNRCTFLEPGDRVKLIDRGGWFWWRVKIISDGKSYWTFYDAF